MPAVPFHLALCVTDLERSRRFYGELLQCSEGRSAKRWLDFDFFGHQLTLHRVDRVAEAAHNPVDGEAVPVPHFGAVLSWPAWQQLAERLREQGVRFVIGPTIRFPDQTGEQGTFFVTDPCGNALEFKSFRNPDRLFARDPPGDSQT